MIRDAITCDRNADCMAVFLEDTDDPELEFEADAALHGWIFDDEAGHTCPACAIDRGPVLERGECLCCGGRTFDRADGAVCQYCRNVFEHPADESEGDISAPQDGPQ